MDGRIAIKPKELDMNVFRALDDEWMAVSALHDDMANAMTASWGGFGILWNKAVAYVFLRPQRFTKKLVDQSPRLTLNFFKGGQKDALSYLGKVSAADVPDKMEECGLKQVRQGDLCYFEEAEIVMVAKKLYRQEMLSECFLDNALVEKNYPGKDFHDVYVCEIEDILIKKG